jgi:hypothetical protein
MRIYIAAKYGRRFELRDVAKRLRGYGHEVTSRWLDNGEEQSMTPTSAALMDIEDVERADTVLFIAEEVGSLNTGGGRYVELGWALARDKRIIAVQPPNVQPTDDGRYRTHEVVFLAHPSIFIVASIDEALMNLK